MALIIDSRLLDCDSLAEITENFNRVLALIDEKTGDLEALANAVKVTVTFDSDGGSEVDAQTVKYNTAAEEPEDPTRDDYTFAGWYLDEDEFDFTTKVVEDITLTAHWTAAAEA